MSFVDGPALSVINRILDLGQNPASGLTEIDEDRLSQTIDTGFSVRRALTPAGSSGIFVGVMENVHGAADNERSTADVYAMGPGFVEGGFPAVVIDADLWC